MAIILAALAALGATLWSAAALAETGDPLDWPGLAAGQSLDASLSLIAFTLLLRLARRHSLAAPFRPAAIARNALAVLALAFIGLTLFVASQEVTAALGFAGIRATSVDLASELGRMALMAALAQLVARHAPPDLAAPGTTPLADPLDLPLAGLRWLEAQGNYVLLHGASGRRLVRATTQAMEARLGPAFVRIHRGAIVRRDAVRGVERRGRRTVVVLDDGAALPVGRAYRDRLRALADRSSPG